MAKLMESLAERKHTETPPCLFEISVVEGRGHVISYWRFHWLNSKPSDNHRRIPRSALAMSARTQRLAQPKPNRLRFPDRRSVYWLDELPPEKTETVTKAALTPRWSKLCRSKNFYAQDIRSPVWEVSRGALQALASSRLCSLAQPRAPAAGWQPDRLLPDPINRVMTVATPRVCQLAEPKKRLILEAGCDKSKSRAKPPRRESTHIEVLAFPKHLHPSYTEERPVSWSVSSAAKRHVTSQRLFELSVPKERKALTEGHDPYVVSQAARSARLSARLQQLCLPLPRKCSSK